MMINTINRIKKYLKAWSENKFFRVVVAFIQQLFLTLLVTYLLLLLVDIIFPGSVSRYLNLNYWLIAVIAAGIITVLTKRESEQTEEEKASINKGNIVTLVCIGLIGAALIWYKTREVGWLSYLISIAGGIMIVLLSLLIWQKNGEKESEEENSPRS